jgi:hypothetical protein
LPPPTPPFSLLLLPRHYDTPLYAFQFRCCMPAFRFRMPMPPRRFSLAADIAIAIATQAFRYWLRLSGASAAMMPLQLAIISPLLAPFSPLFSLSLPAGQRHAIAAFTPPLYALPPADMLLILTPYANFAFRFRHLAFLCRWLSFMPRRHFRRFRRCRRLISPLSC